MRKPLAIFFLFLGLLLLVAAWVLSADDSEHENHETHKGQVEAATALAEGDTKVGPQAETFVRESEQEPTPENPTTGSKVSLQVVDESGRGFAQARIVPWFGEQIGTTRITDDDGNVSLDYWIGSGGVAVFPRNHRSQYFPLQFTGESLVLEVKPGQSLAGSVTIHQPMPSGEPFSMTVEAKPEYPQGMNWDLLGEISRRARREKYSVIQVEPNGHFQMDGLDFNWSGALRISRGYVLCSVSAPGEMTYGSEIEVSKLSQDLQIEVTQLPFFTGRILTPDGLGGVAGIQIRGVATFNPEKMNGILVEAITLEDGSFRMPIVLTEERLRDTWCDSPQSIVPFDVDLECVGNEQWGSTTLVQELDPSGDPWNLGDIRLTDWVKIPFLVVDENGNPLSGALGYSGELSEPTGADGRSFMRIHGSVEKIAFGAKGYSSFEMELPKPLPAELKVTLQRATAIEVSWTAPEGIDMSLLTLSLAGEQGVIEQASLYVPFEYAFQRAFGVKPEGSTGRSDLVQKAFWSLKKNQKSFELWGLRPGVPIQVSLVDSGKAPVSAVEVVLRAKETRKINLEIAFAPVTLSGSVVDDSGLVVPGAMVWVSTSRGQSIGSETNEQGQFSIAGIGAPQVAIEVTKEGYVTYYDAEFTVPFSGACLPIALQAGRNLTIYVEDETGREILGMHCRYNGVSMDVDGKESGGQIINNAPRSAFQMEWLLGGNQGFVEVPANVTEFSIEVPAMASVGFDVHSEALDDGRFFRIELVAQGFDLPGREGGVIRKGVFLSKMETQVTLEVPALMPGLYLVRFLSRPLGPGAEQQLISEVGPVEFVAGENPRIPLRQ